MPLEGEAEDRGPSGEGGPEAMTVEITQVGEVAGGPTGPVQPGCTGPVRGRGAGLPSTCQHAARPACQPT